MAYRTKPRYATDRAEAATPAGRPICRRLLSLEQAADGSGEPAQQICLWIMAGELPAYDLAGGLRIDEVELADLLSSKRPSPEEGRMGERERSTAVDHG